MSSISGAVRDLRTTWVGLCLLGATLLPLLAAPPTASASQLPAQIHTVAGGGGCTGAVTLKGLCDGVSATSVPIAGVRSLAALPTGGYVYIDYGNDLVRMVSPTGVVRTVAGTSTRTALTAQFTPSTSDVDCVPATQSGLDDPVGVAALPNGGLLITEFGGSRVRMVAPDGTITTIAGVPPTASVTTTDDNPGGSAVLAVNTAGLPPTGTVVVGDQTLTYTSITATSMTLPQPTTDDIPAGSTIELASAVGCPEYSATGAGTGTGTSLHFPSDAVPTAAGGVLIADTYANRVMLLSSWSNPGSALQQVAGGGACRDATGTCQGLPASQVALDLPDSVSELPDGSGAYLVSELGADAVRQISQEAGNGVFTTVAGEPGRAGYGGDNGLATAAQLNRPEEVVATSDGGFLIADTGNNVVRDVLPNDYITTIAGDGVLGSAGDGGAATAAELNGPSGVTVTFQGAVLIADDNNDAIRQITQAPVNTISFTPSSPNGKHGWFTVEPSIIIGSNQASTIACVVDPGQAPPVFGAIAPGCDYFPIGQFTENGTHTLYVAGQNSFGDQENPVSVTFKVDTQPPTVKCGAERTFRHGQRRAKVTAILKDSISGPKSRTLTVSVSTKRGGVHRATLRGANLAGLSTTVHCRFRVRARMRSTRR